MAGLSFDQIKSAKKNLRKAPPPKVPLGSTSSENGDFSSDAGNVSVAAFRNRFEQKQSPTSNGQFGSLSHLSGDNRTSGENITSSRAKFEKFEQKSAKKPPPPRKPPIGVKSSEMLRRLDDNSNALKGEPIRKELPLFNRIGAAPHKKHKPANLKFKLGKYKDKIVQSNGTNHTDRGCNEGRALLIRKIKINQLTYFVPYVICGCARKAKVKARDTFHVIRKLINLPVARSIG